MSNLATSSKLQRLSVLAAGLLFCFSALIARGQEPSGTNQKVHVGFIEDDQRGRTDWAPGVSAKRIIKPAFERTSSGWQEVVHVNQKMTWTIAFDGRKLGEVQSQPDQEEQQSETSGPYVGVQSILGPIQALPAIGEPSQKFAGVLAVGPGKVRRPLVVISSSNFTDPDTWKRTKANTQLTELVRTAFRQDFPHVDNCAPNEGPVIHDYKFPDSDLDLTAKYGSNKGSFLVQVHLKHSGCGYINNPNDPFVSQWFFVASDSSVRRLGGFMELLDAGDYDADGKSEVIFFLHQPEDTDGYVLFYDDFHQRIASTWEYH